MKRKRGNPTDSLETKERKAKAKLGGLERIQSCLSSVDFEQFDDSSLKSMIALDLWFTPNGAVYFNSDDSDDEFETSDVERKRQVCKSLFDRISPELALRLLVEAFSNIHVESGSTIDSGKWRLALQHKPSGSILMFGDVEEAFCIWTPWNKTKWNNRSRNPEFAIEREAWWSDLIMLLEWMEQKV
jgi:hypothetical protein